MKDLIQCTVARNDFQRWLELGHTPLTIWQGEKATTVLTRLEKRPSLDYLYQTSLGQDNSISWNNGLTFCGAYDIKNQTLYLTEGSMVSLAAGQAPLAINTGVSVMKEICEKINRQVETTIANDSSNLPVVTNGSWGKLNNFEFIMNRAYALNRDKLKCRVCGGWLISGIPLAHRVNPNLPLNKVNRVDNLVSLHKHCFDTVNNPYADISEFDAKAQKKIQGFREKLVASHTCNK